MEPKGLDKVSLQAGGWHAFCSGIAAHVCPQI